MKRTIWMLSIFLSLGCSTISHEYNKANYPDEIHIYKLPQFSNYFVRVKCEDVKNRPQASKTIITDKTDISRLYSLFEDEQNFTVEPDYDAVDSKILFEYRKKGLIINSICWTQTKLIQRNGKVYSYNKKVEDYLLSKKLIIVFTTDTIR